MTSDETDVLCWSGSTSDGAATSTGIDVVCSFESTRVIISAIAAEEALSASGSLI